MERNFIIHPSAIDDNMIENCQNFLDNETKIFFNILQSVIALKLAILNVITDSRSLF